MATQAEINFADNEDFEYGFKFVDVSTGVPHDFTGSTFSMDVRTSADAPSAEATLTSANGGIVSTDLAIAEIQVSIVKGTLTAGNYVYDLLRINGASTERLLFGSLIVVDGVTP